MKKSKEITKKYNEIYAENQARIARLKFLLQEHRKDQRKYPNQWASVSDIAHTNILLSEILEFLGNNRSSSEK